MVTHIGGIEMTTPVDTKFDDFPIGPLFPSGCDELMKLLEADLDNEFSVETLADHRDGIPIYGAQTEDGYTHNTAIAFEVDSSTVVVLFPHIVNDRCERPIAVYVGGDAVPDEKLENLIGLIISTLEEMISEHD